jgi:hypothetical protein
MQAQHELPPAGRPEHAANVWQLTTAGMTEASAEQTIDPADAQLAVDDRIRTGAHAARADRMEHRVGRRRIAAQLSVVRSALPVRA